ncbi:hypothetical protein [Demequina aurantiaca]|uniref:hypothetical protein n=1 Tax=Demequina aurantiaca TaxID=676200 RepID=UPI003D334870
MAATPNPEQQPAVPPRVDAGKDSFLNSLRQNRMGVLTAALVVALVLGLVLTVLVPDQPGAFVMILLGVLIAAGVGFTVRYLSEGKGLLTQIVAFIATVLGVHVMAVTGAAAGSFPLLEKLGSGGPGFDDALLIALATPAISAGGVLAGLVAAIIAGWGAKQAGRIDLD